VQNAEHLVSAALKLVGNAYEFRRKAGKTQSPNYDVKVRAWRTVKHVEDGKYSRLPRDAAHFHDRCNVYVLAQESTVREEQV
jgi:hypothetical protein